MRFDRRLICTLIVCLVSTSSVALAGDGDGYFDHSRLEKTVAWSADGRSFAWRRELLQWHDSAMGGGPAAEGVPSSRSQIDVVVQRCGSEEPTRVFPVTTYEDQSKKSRGKQWKKAERWLAKSGYVFVAGKKAKPIEMDLVETTEVPDLLTLPFPRSALPEHMDHLQLVVGPGVDPKPEESKLFLGFRGHVKGEQHAWRKLEAFLLADDIPGLSEGTECSIAYGPKAACAVITCASYRAYTATQMIHRAVPVKKLESLLPPAP